MGLGKRVRGLGPVENARGRRDAFDALGLGLGLGLVKSARGGSDAFVAFGVSEKRSW